VFNDDANTDKFIIDRNTYSAGFKVKPSALGGSATVAVDYEGYTRDGNKFAPLLLNGFGGGGGPGTGGGVGSALNPERWRGINLSVDEYMNRVGLTLTASPRRMFELAYEVSFEEFVSDAPEVQMERDITNPNGLPLPNGTSPVASLFYVPDTHLVKQGLKVSKNFNDRVMVAAG